MLKICLRAACYVWRISWGADAGVIEMMTGTAFYWEKALQQSQRHSLRWRLGARHCGRRERRAARPWAGTLQARQTGESPEATAARTPSSHTTLQPPLTVHAHFWKGPKGLFQKERMTWVSCQHIHPVKKSVEILRSGFPSGKLVSLASPPGTMCLVYLLLPFPIHLRGHTYALCRPFPQRQCLAMTTGRSVRWYDMPCFTSNWSREDDGYLRSHLTCSARM